MNLFSLENKVAIVTGGGRGLGRAMALALAKAGADVVVASRTRSQLEKVAEEIQETGVRSLPLVVDVSKRQDVQEMVSEVKEKLGRIDILVNAAGVNKRMPSLEVTSELWDQIVEINLKGTFLCCQAVAPYMIKQRSGSIINIASLLSAIGIPSLAPYAASKSGVVGLTRVLAAEWAPYGVRVNCIGPGYFRTEMTHSLFADKEWVGRLLRKIPLGRAGVPEDLAGTVVFLASQASGYVTGQALYVDGGFLTSWEK